MAPGNRLALAGVISSSANANNSDALVPLRAPRTGPSIIPLAIVVILNIFQRVCLTVIIFLKQGSFLDVEMVEMVEKVFYPKFMRRSAFWGTPKSNYLTLLLLLTCITVLFHVV